MFGVGDLLFLTLDFIFKFNPLRHILSTLHRVML